MPDTFRNFIDRWSQPAVVVTLVTAIVYGIIWGVQLNSAVLTQSAISATLSQEMLRMKSDTHSAALLNARTASVLEQISKQIDRLEARMERNEGWINESLGRPGE